MEWTRRKAMIIYIVFLLICFSLGGIFFPEDVIVEFEITCNNGEVELFNISDKYICGGHPNPLRNNIIETDLSLMIDKFK